MAAGFEITQAMVQVFRSNVEHLAQQTKARFAGTVLEDTIDGERGYIEQLAPDDMVDVTTRHADTPIFAGGWERRAVNMVDADWGKLVDSQDKLRLIVDPMGAYVIALNAAINRRKDLAIANAFFSTAYTGHDGTTAVTWPTAPTGLTNGTQVAVDSWKYGNGSGVAALTISKLIEARVALLTAEAAEDGEGNTGDSELYFACGAKQLGALLATTEATARDFGTTKDEIGALVSGKLDTLLGFKFIRYEKMPTNASGYRRCAAWAKGAMGFGMPGAVPVIRTSERADKRYAWQVYGTISLGATRMQEAKLVEVICNEP